MHVQHQSFALRLLVLGLVWCAVPAFIWWSLDTVQHHNLALRPVLPEFVPTALPDDQDRVLLHDAMVWAKATPTETAIDRLDGTLLAPRQEARAATSLTMLMSRGRERLAMIDGRVFAKGDALPDGRVIRDITPQGVVLLTAGQAELTPWIPPLSVRLEKAAKVSPVPTEAAPASNATVADPVQGGTMRLDAQQAMQLMKQLETTQRHAK